MKSSWCIMLLSFAECVTYIVASFFGDYLKGRLVYINVIAASALAVICIIWPYIDVSYTIICLISIGEHPDNQSLTERHPRQQPGRVVL